MPAVLLVVPPCHEVPRPSIGVSLLKAALARSGIACDVLYLNLRFAELAGAEFYGDLTETAVSYRALVGEWIFTGDLFGEQAPDPQAYLDEVLGGQLGRDAGPAFLERVQELRGQATAFLDHAMEEVAWERYAMVGASSTFQQNCASLALLRRVKQRYPGISTVMGGANCDGAMGAALHELFPFVDYVCSGEGDRVFPLLVEKVLAGESADGLPGIFARGGLNLAGDETRAPLVLDLDHLPYPDYEDYFAQLAASGLGASASPVLCFETSRGCWWGEKHQCTFCGLNGGGLTYRSKSPGRALDELDILIDRYGVRVVGLTDNILDPGYFETFIKSLADRDRPPSLFYETKANLTREQLRLLVRAGVDDIQPGIESLSTPILRLMNKGVTALQNVRLLKWCAELGIMPHWNLLYGFPGEGPAEYERMAALVPSLTHLEPPKMGAIRIDRFSPFFKQPDVYGFVNVRAAPPYRHLYPFPAADLDRLAYHFQYEYADGRDPERYTLALQQAVAEWNAIRGTARLEQYLIDDRLEIEDTRPAAVNGATVLRGPARLAYLALDAGASVPAVRAALERTLGKHAPDAEQIERWLEEWLAARLVMREGPRYLSLAVDSTDRLQLLAERLAARAAVTTGDQRLA